VKEITVGVRPTRGAPIQFVMSSESDLSVGDVVLVESPPARYLAFVALSTDQIQSTPEQFGKGRVVAGPGSLEVREALLRRDAAALERARLALGPHYRVAGATWSADGGRLTLDIAAGDRDIDTLAETLEPVFRAEVRIRELTQSARSELRGRRG
jgi:hypothetical protein